ncbi:nucleotide sugar dehydrogenase [Sediminibacillus dalangtanensis]|uniref:UDP-glucose 6-dehydrogenase n=1 Tax=Sediminibacillus dalangtanensis TaxID=2729421 RepID=A0ABX7VYE9_9BACI|nr:UDP-glucose/GDP-mannose dehydrogenase family protein [Sediminibacillus dalangtanensis]QTN00826.1 nucleotide sugar dehydrogenase [Sediminibacillus dalangtanensis]
MNIAVIGTGYVGLVTGVCLAEIGHSVTCLDIDEEKIGLLNHGKSPIFEEGLEDLLEKNLQRGRLDFTTDYWEGLAGKEIIYLAVGTPETADGSADLTFIEAAGRAIAAHLKQNAVIVTKSTVPVGTNQSIKRMIESELAEPVQIRIVSNPEFLRQGTAVHDTFHGDRIVIGSDDPAALALLEEINRPFQLPIVKTDLRSAEMIKYASNAFLAAKISFINEMAHLCAHVGANVDNVAEGMGMDSRIGGKFLQAGVGYGGSCFPKDTNALIAMGRSYDYPMPLLGSVQHVNDKQRDWLVEMIQTRLGNLEGKTIALLGMTFKPNTDDMRESPAIRVAEQLQAAGATLRGYDPVAVLRARQVMPATVMLTDNLQEAVQGADCAVIITDWKQVKDLPLEEYAGLLASPLLFDGRNCFNLKVAEASGIEYHSIGRPIVNSPGTVSSLASH